MARLASRKADKSLTSQIRQSVFGVTTKYQPFAVPVDGIAAEAHTDRLELFSVRRVGILHGYCMDMGKGNQWMGL